MRHGSLYQGQYRDDVRGHHRNIFYESLPDIGPISQRCLKLSIINVLLLFNWCLSAITCFPFQQNMNLDKEMAQCRLCGSEGEKKYATKGKLSIWINKALGIDIKKDEQYHPHLVCPSCRLKINRWRSKLLKHHSHGDCISSYMIGSQSLTHVIWKNVRMWAWKLACLYRIEGPQYLWHKSQMILLPKSYLLKKMVPGTVKFLGEKSQKFVPRMVWHSRWKCDRLFPEIFRAGIM